MVCEISLFFLFHYPHILIVPKGTDRINRININKKKMALPYYYACLFISIHTYILYIQYFFIKYHGYIII